MLFITPAGQAVIRAQLEAEKGPDLGLRVAAKPDQKGSIEYAFGIDEAKDDDNIIEFEGFNLLISPHSEDWLDGATMDYVEMAPGDFRFIFLNPNDPSYKPPSE
jgi:iron-sulfur cluster assembly protein